MNINPSTYYSKLTIIGVIFLFTSLVHSTPLYMENLGRGVIAINHGDGKVYIGWRMLATDPKDIAFNLYRSTGGGTAVKLNRKPITESTNWIDEGVDMNQSNSYFVRPVVKGKEQTANVSYTVPANVPVQPYISIPLQIPAGDTTTDGVAYTYNANDCSVGDLDGDGEYEIVLKWDPSNSKDNAQSGYTGNVILDAYELNGTHLWRIDLGINIRAGAHYTQFMVYDLDGDCKAEVACKTAPGTVDGKGNNVILPGDNPEADYRNSSGYILSGPEYLTIFNGETGTALVTTNYIPPRHPTNPLNPTSEELDAIWGDSYGNRMDRFLACIAYLDGVKPSLVMCRGYYTRTVLVAWNWRDGKLANVWTFDSNTPRNSGYAGQGNHNLSVGDVDGDGKDEIVYGACCIDDDGRGLYATGLGHGDAMHLSDMDPDKPGLEVWDVHEVPNPICGGGELRDAKTGELIFGLPGPGDTGRGLALDIDPRYKGYEMWSSASDGIYTVNGTRITTSRPSVNFGVWWDGDLLRELLDGPRIGKWDYSTNSTTTLLSAFDYGCVSNNWTKANPCLSADILGDWREEVIWRTRDNRELRIFTTTIPTTYRFCTLMHDPQYRLGIAWQNVAYNQPPHPGFCLGVDMDQPPSKTPPVRPCNLKAIAFPDKVKFYWDKNTERDFVGYNIYRSEKPEGPFGKLNLSLLKENSYIDKSVVIETIYYYAVTAVDTRSNESYYSDIVRMRPTQGPFPPWGLVADSEMNAIKLSWRKNTRKDVEGYNVYRSLSSGESYTKLNETLLSDATFTDTQVQDNITYYYVVTTIYDKSLETFYSKELSATPGNKIRIQAEDATIGESSIEDSYWGYNGKGFVNFGSNGSFVEFRNINGRDGGEYILQYKYALGAPERAGLLIVNDQFQSIKMHDTGDPSSWRTDSVTITLNKGTNNTIRFQTIGHDFGNLDEIIIIPKERKEE